MARWRLHLVLLIVVLLIAALATWRISGYPPEVRAARALRMPLLWLRGLQGPSLELPGSFLVL